jgi:hypothetical protein
MLLKRCGEVVEVDSLRDCKPPLRGLYFTSFVITLFGVVVGFITNPRRGLEETQLEGGGESIPAKTSHSKPAQNTRR